MSYQKTDILSKDPHPKKVAFSIDFTDSGIEIYFNDEHSLNAIFPIEDKEEGLSNTFHLT